MRVKRLSPLVIAVTVTGLVPGAAALTSRRRVTMPPTVRAVVAPVLMGRGWFLTAGAVRSVYYDQNTPLGDAPPARLVTDGMFARRRNPMTVGVVAVLVGWFLASGRPAVLLWCALVIAVSRQAILRVEEPTLEQAFGRRYRDYRQLTPRWGWTRA